MQDEGSALLRRVSLALSIFWGVGLVSMVCTSAILQNSSLHSQIDPQVYQQAVDSLHGRTSIPLSMLALAAFEVVTGIVSAIVRESMMARTLQPSFWVSSLWPYLPYSSSHTCLS